MMDTSTRKESESHERASSPDRLEEKVGHIARYSQKQAPHLLLLAFVPPHLSDAAAERGGSAVLAIWMSQQPYLSSWSQHFPAISRVRNSRHRELFPETKNTVLLGPPTPLSPPQFSQVLGLLGAAWLLIFPIFFF